MDILPLYKLVIDPDAEGMDYMGLVDVPAHGKSWVAFNKQFPSQKEEFKQHFNEDKRIVTGVAIATNLQIYRRREDGTEYNVYFTPEDTLIIAQELFKNGYMHNVNEMHDMNKDVSDMFLYESFFVNEDKSNIPAAFADQNLQPGSWIVSYKVENDEVWEKIKDQEFVGFSIEGWFKEVETNLKKEEMKKSFVTISEVSRWSIEVFEDDITVGTTLHWSWDGEPDEPLRAGEYEWEGHKLLVDSTGTVKMIDGSVEEVTLKAKSKSKKMKKKDSKKPSLMEQLFGKKSKPEGSKPLKFDKEKHGEATTVDGVVVMWEGDMPAVDGSLFVEDAENEGEMILADAGEYSFEIDGTLWVATVDEAGVITALVEAEDDGDGEEEVMQAMKAMKKDYEGKLASQQKAFDAKIKTMAEAFDDLKDKFEDATDPDNTGEGKKKHSGDKKPGWRKQS